MSQNYNKWNSMNRNNGKPSVFPPGLVLLCLGSSALLVMVGGFQVGLIWLGVFAGSWWYLTKGGKK